MTALKRLFGAGFRVFFLAAGLFAILSIAVWAAWLALQAAGGAADWPTAAAPHLWHAHEMIFGYGAAALGGFFLTAVPNWTGARAAPQGFIAAVAGLWLLIRVALWRGLWTRDKPILWALHLSCAVNAVGFLAYGWPVLGSAPRSGRCISLVSAGSAG